MPQIETSVGEVYNYSDDNKSFNGAFKDDDAGSVMQAYVFISRVWHRAANTGHSDMGITDADLIETEAKLGMMDLETTIGVMKEVLLMHEHDQNFPHGVLDNIKLFINDPDVLANPEQHQDLIREMKLEAILVTENSPYAEVRAVVDNTDDPDMPVGTFRAWFIGLLFVIGGAFINQLFSIRQPAITVTANVAQVLACK
jgi:hypothetical protein